MDFFATGGFQQLFSELLEDVDCTAPGGGPPTTKLLGIPEMPTFYVDLKGAYEEWPGSAASPVGGGLFGDSATWTTAAAADSEVWHMPPHSECIWSEVGTFNYDDGDGDQRFQRIYEELPAAEVEILPQTLTELSSASVAMSHKHKNNNNNNNTISLKMLPSNSTDPILQNTLDFLLSPSSGEYEVPCATTAASSSTSQPGSTTRQGCLQAAYLIDSEDNDEDDMMMTAWEQKFLDDFVELPELIDCLPAKTPLCTSTCELFLHESSTNLRLEAAAMPCACPPTEAAVKDATKSTTKARPRKVRRQKSPPELDRRKGDAIAEVLPATSNDLDDLPPPKTEAATSADQRHSPLSPDRDRSGYPCTYGSCRNIYAKPAHLKAHLRRHLGEKPYACTWPDCLWKFSRSDELARHRRSHSGVKPYKCIYCTKCFARSDHLTKHRKVHERRMIAANREGRAVNGVLPASVFTVRPGRKRKNQTC